MSINFKRITGLGAVNFKTPSATPTIVTDGLILNLDASNPSSYPGTGTVWSDISGNNNNFNIVAGAYNNTGVKYMDFGGNYGIAKNTADIPLSGNTGITYVVWTRIKNSSTDWRTLTRTYSVNADHQVIIEFGGWSIGMYTPNVGFLSSGYSQQSLPNYGTSNWICMYWRFQNTSPYYELSYNDSPEIIRGSITNANAAYTDGFGSIGGYHNGNITPSNAAQYWGDIAQFLCYDRKLTNSELLQDYNATKTRFGL